MPMTTFVILYFALGLAWAYHRAACCPGLGTRTFQVLAWPIDVVADWCTGYA